jgi:hypothetical protein
LSVLDPLTNGLTYHTIVQDGRMVHVGHEHLLLADFGTGQVASFTWDEVVSAMARLLSEQEEKKRIAGIALSTPKPTGLYRLRNLMRRAQ